jgi:hypothetical protein
MTLRSIRPRTVRRETYCNCFRRRFDEKRTDSHSDFIYVVRVASYGFRHYRGGPIYNADMIGLRAVHAGILKYRLAHGPMHWDPALMLTRLVHEGRTLADWDR